MPEEIYSHIGERIRRYRELHEMSQEELAKAIHVTPNTISRWETATYRPTVADIDILARVFDEPIWAFLPAGSKPPTNSQEVLFSATGDLPQEDIDELARYADFIRARKALRSNKQKTRRKRND